MLATREVTTTLGEALAQKIGTPRYQLWFAGKTDFRWDGAQLTVGVANRHHQECLQRSFLQPLREVVSQVLGPASVKFVIDPVLFQEHRKAQAETAEFALPLPGIVAEAERTVGLAAVSKAAESGVHATERAPVAAPMIRPSSRRWMALEDFVVGPCNRLAHAAVRQVLDRPEEAPLPLTLYGPAGTGKTHLLEGMYIELKRTLGEGAIIYTSAEEFTNRFLPAIRSSQMGGFRKQFRETQALLVDNLHFLAGKESTQEEFLHTFEALRRLGRPVVVTCDTHPRLQQALFPELVDRLLAGGVWGTELPDHLTRQSLLQARSQRLGITLPKDALTFLADRLKGNVRELEGVLNTIRHHHQVQERPVTLALVREATGGLFRQQAKIITLQELERTFCQVTGVEAKALHQQSRARAVSHPRMVLMFLARRVTGASYSEIARFFGSKSHSTVIAAEKKVKIWLVDDSPLFAGLDRCPVRDVIENVERALEK